MESCYCEWCYIMWSMCASVSLWGWVSSVSFDDEQTCVQTHVVYLEAGDNDSAAACCREKALLSLMFSRCYIWKRQEKKGLSKKKNSHIVFPLTSLLLSISLSFSRWTGRSLHTLSQIYWAFYASVWTHSAPQRCVCSLSKRHSGVKQQTPCLYACTSRFCGVLWKRQIMNITGAAITLCDFTGSCKSGNCCRDYSRL